MPDVLDDGRLSRIAIENWIFNALIDETRDAWRIAPILAGRILQGDECPFCGDDQDV